MSMQTKPLRQKRAQSFERRAECGGTQPHLVPLKQDLWRNEYNCQIALIGSFLNKRDCCWWFILTRQGFGRGVVSFFWDIIWVANTQTEERTVRVSDSFVGKWRNICN